MGDPEKASATVEIKNKSGLHARPASLFVKKSAEFDSDIYIKKEDGLAINAKSIMGVLNGGIEQGTVITIEAEGEDAQQAIDALLQLVEKLDLNA